MLFLFIGFLFVFLNCEIPVGAGALDLMPAFVGYFLILLGCQKINDGASRFLRMRLFSVLLAIVSLTVTVLALIPLPMGSAVSLFVSIFSMAGALYVAYEAVGHVKERERKVGRPLGGNDLASSWFLLAFGNLISLFAGYMESMALLCLALQLLSIAWFEAALYRAWRKMEPPKK